MRTFSIHTLGCKVNQYESEQIAALLRSRGLVQTSDRQAELRIINTCSVTMQAASKSRQTARRMVKLPVLASGAAVADEPPPQSLADSLASGAIEKSLPESKLILTGCWATSDKAEAAALPGVDAVLGHHDDLAAELDKLLTAWQTPSEGAGSSETLQSSLPPKSVEDDGWMIQAGTLAGNPDPENKPKIRKKVNQNRLEIGPGTTRLPMLGDHQSGRQRAYLKIQDGCDAHCTYCIIPQLRPRLWSKPIDDAVDEARRLVDAGHVEIVLTGIFMGAFGHATALRRRQRASATTPLMQLTEALCTRVPGLGRLRFSSLEPGDMTPDLVAVLRSHPQVVPHFHLPLQSGSDRILHRMNRQYTRDDFLRMIDNVNAAFDRPAITTDILVGFPGEGDAEFDDTFDVARRTGFIHIHAFSYSPRPATAAARWTDDFVRGPVVNERINALTDLAAETSYAFRRGFEGQTVELLVEQLPRDDRTHFPPLPPGEGRDEGAFPLSTRDKPEHPLTPTLSRGERGQDAIPRAERRQDQPAIIRHGRSERYFDVHFASDTVQTGDLVRVRIDRVTPSRTIGSLA